MFAANERRKVTDSVRVQAQVEGVRGEQNITAKVCATSLFPS